jgi:hypothetical protein
VLGLSRQEQQRLRAARIRPAVESGGLPSPLRGMLAYVSMLNREQAAGWAHGRTRAQSRPRHPLVVLALSLLCRGRCWRRLHLGLRHRDRHLAMVRIGHNLLLGYTGLLSFGHGLFFGLAAYCVALTQLHWFPNSLLLPLAAGVLFAGLLGVAIGFLALRRRGVYFSLLTLAFTALTYTIVFRWTSFTGGENGLSGVRRLPLAGLDLDDQRTFYYFCAVIVLLTAWLLWRVVHAPLGTVLLAIRENEQRARFAGYPVRHYKLAAFVVSTLVVGLGGSLFALLSCSCRDLVHVSFSGERWR